MRTLTTLVLVLSTVACKKKEAPAPAVETAPSTTTGTPPVTPLTPPPVTPPVTAAVVETPEAPGDAAAQCKRILGKAWTAIGPGLAKLQIAADASLEKELTETSYDSRSFLEACPAAPRAYRTCIEAAENPLHFIGPCRDRMAEPKPTELAIPKVPGTSPLLPPVALASGEASKLKAKLVGTWQNTGPFGVETWTIDKSGKVVVTKMRDGKAETPSHPTFDLTFEHQGQLTVHFPGSNTQGRSLFVAEDGKTLYTSGNLMWSVYPMGDGKTFVVKSGFDWVFASGGACEVVTFYGSVVPATCAFADRDGGKFFDVSYQIPGKVRWGTTEPEPTTYALPVFDTSLVAPELIKNEAFTRT